MIVLVFCLTLAQGTTQTAPFPNPYGPGLRSPATPPASHSPARSFQRRRFLGPSLWLQTGTGSSVTNQHPLAAGSETPPAQASPLKDLVISPVYEKEKHSPKLIEIP
jgi:hypothetical protein